MKRSIAAWDVLIRRRATRLARLHIVARAPIASTYRIAEQREAREQALRALIAAVEGRERAKQALL